MILAINKNHRVWNNCCEWTQNKTDKRNNRKEKIISIHAENRKFPSTHKSKLPKNGEIYIDSMTHTKVS